eukprot:470525-Pyramimonas_sp.AAC.1
MCLCLPPLATLRPHAPGRSGLEFGSAPSACSAKGPRKSPLQADGSVLFICVRCKCHSAGSRVKGLGERCE